MSFCRVLDNGETETGAARAPGSIGFVEALKYAGKVRGVYALAGVGDVYCDDAGLRSGGDFDGTASRRVFDGVLEKGDKCAFEEIAFGLNLWGQVRHGYGDQQRL